MVDGRRSMPSWSGEYLMGQRMVGGTAAESVAERHAQPYHATGDYPSSYGRIAKPSRERDL
jgi:hypothetical protein